MALYALKLVEFQLEVLLFLLQEKEILLSIQVAVLAVVVIAIRVVAIMFVLLIV